MKEPGQTGHLGLRCSVGVLNVDSSLDQMDRVESSWGEETPADTIQVCRSGYTEDIVGEGVGENDCRGGSGGT